MSEEFISALEEFVDNIIPSNEDIDIIVNKINNNEQLDFYDNITLEKVRLLNLIKNNKGGKI